ncbi:hypothetical protein GCM10022243_33290 [Saccharothrix violaceirubra]|uniref:Helicase XPB/Ssl2 N-terminal domain-containing protein n=1 Tax=Saccharothrix violaceirubra TaxID=413306 RepID=A0A7W7T085_9PSEU|nr:helicase-associated domain-containing protein [Saccharothrix violaceirubra]MBB4964179.1 hypothetical protein [Saccharothrix violaceirubra]
MGRTTALAVWLTALDFGHLRDVLTRRPDAAATRPHTLRALAEALLEPTSVDRAVDTLDQGCLDVLDTVVALGSDATADAVAHRLRCTGKASRSDLRRALTELRTCALVWPDGDALRTIPDRRPTAKPRRITSAPRAPRRVSVDRATVDNAATEAATALVEGIGRLLEHCDVHRTDSRSLPGARDANPHTARFRYTLASRAGLLATVDDRVLPTSWADAWADAHPAVRLARLVTAWLADSRHRSVVARHAELADGTAFADRDEAVADLVWSRRGTAVVLTEAEEVGLIASGALTGLGKAALDGVVDEAADQYVHAEVSRVRFLPDLSVAVRGLPNRALGRVLGRCAEHDGVYWRFTEQSVRRALDTGRDSVRVLAELSQVGDVPPELDTLVRSVARRHGRVTVTAVACCVRSDDRDLLLELLEHPRLTTLSLEALAPTVLASAKPVKETLARLRAAGYAPSGTGVDGTATIERAPRERGEPAPPPPRSRTIPLADRELTALALALSGRERSRATPLRADLRRAGTARMLRDESLVLRDSEVALLADALVTRTCVEIDFAHGPRTTTKHVITPVDHAAGNLKASLEPRGEHHEFAVGRIRSVREVREMREVH